MELKTLEAGGGHHEGVVFAGVELAQARADVAANGKHFKVRIVHAEHELAAKAGSAHAGAGGHVVKARVLRGDEGVARILAFAHGDEVEALGKLHRNVLEGVHGEIGLARLHGDFKLLHEESLAAHLGERAVEDLVASRRHAEELHARGRIAGAQHGLDVKGLPHGKGAFAGGDDAAFEIGHDDESECL